MKKKSLNQVPHTMLLFWTKEAPAAAAKAAYPPARQQKRKPKNQKSSIEKKNKTVETYMAEEVMT